MIKWKPIFWRLKAIKFYICLIFKRSRDWKMLLAWQLWSTQDRWSHLFYYIITFLSWTFKHVWAKLQSMTIISSYWPARCPSFRGDLYLQIYEYLYVTYFVHTSMRSGQSISQCLLDEALQRFAFQMKIRRSTQVPRRMRRVTVRIEVNFGEIFIRPQGNSLFSTPKMEPCHRENFTSL